MDSNFVADEAVCPPYELGPNFVADEGEAMCRTSQPSPGETAAGPDNGDLHKYPAGRKLRQRGVGVADPEDSICLPPSQASSSETPCETAACPEADFPALDAHEGEAEDRRKAALAPIAEQVPMAFPAQAADIIAAQPPDITLVASRSATLREQGNDLAMSAHSQMPKPMRQHHLGFRPRPAQPKSQER